LFGRIFCIDKKGELLYDGTQLLDFIGSRSHAGPSPPISSQSTSCCPCKRVSCMQSHESVRSPRATCASGLPYRAARAYSRWSWIPPALQSLWNSTSCARAALPLCPQNLCLEKKNPPEYVRVDFVLFSFEFYV